MPDIPLIRFVNQRWQGSILLLAAWGDRWAHRGMMSAASRRRRLSDQSLPSTRWRDTRASRAKWRAGGWWER